MYGDGLGLTGLVDARRGSRDVECDLRGVGSGTTSTRLPLGKVACGSRGGVVSGAASEVQSPNCCSSAAVTSASGTGPTL